MNSRQRESLAKLFYDLVKVPLGLCCFGALVSRSEDMGAYIFFGLSFSLLFAYVGYRLDEQEG